MAPVGTAGEHARRADVRLVCEPFVRPSQPASRSRESYYTSKKGVVTTMSSQTFHEFGDPSNQVPMTEQLSKTTDG
jgi:hypothetical protein